MLNKNWLESKIQNLDDKISRGYQAEPEYQALLDHRASLEVILQDVREEESRLDEMAAQFEADSSLEKGFEVE